MLRQRTATLHRQAEQSGIIGAVFSGRASLAAYTLFLRNLLPAYHALESGLLRNREKPGMAALARPEVFRGAAIERDLAHLGGGLETAERLPLLREAEEYALRIGEAAAEGAHPLLLAHAYTRFLGDLGGGPILKRRLASLFGLTPDRLSFYAFPDITDLALFAQEYRHALDVAAELSGDVTHVVEESAVAFQLNIALSDAVWSHSAAQGPPH